MKLVIYTKPVKNKTNNLYRNWYFVKDEHNPKWSGKLYRTEKGAERQLNAILNTQAEKEFAKRHANWNLECEMEIHNLLLSI